MSRPTDSARVVVSNTSEQLTLRAIAVDVRQLIFNSVVAVVVTPAAMMGCAVLGLASPVLRLSLPVTAALLAIAIVAARSTSRVQIVVERGGDLVARDGLWLPTTTALPAAAIRQVFCQAHSWVENRGNDEDQGGEGFRLHGARLLAQTRDGRDHLLAAGLLRPATAQALEVEIERFLGIADVKMTGAL